MCGKYRGLNFLLMSLTLVACGGGGGTGSTSAEGGGKFSAESYQSSQQFDGGLAGTWMYIEKSDIRYVYPNYEPGEYFDSMSEARLLLSIFADGGNVAIAVCNDDELELKPVNVGTDGVISFEIRWPLYFVGEQISSNAITGELVADEYADIRTGSAELVKISDEPLITHEASPQAIGVFDVFGEERVDISELPIHCFTQVEVDVERFTENELRTYSATYLAFSSVDSAIPTPTEIFQDAANRYPEGYAVEISFRRPNRSRDNTYFSFWNSVGSGEFHADPDSLSDDEFTDVSFLSDDTESISGVISGEHMDSLSFDVAFEIVVL